MTVVSASQTRDHLICPSPSPRHFSKHRANKTGLETPPATLLGEGEAAQALPVGRSSRAGVRLHTGRLHVHDPLPAFAAHGCCVLLVRDKTGASMPV